MKKISVTTVLCSLHFFVQAQPPYPATPPAPVNIDAVEYFYSSKPEFGTGTALTGFTVSTNISNFNGTVSLTGITPGLHRFYIRSKDINGIWSHTNSSFFDNYNVPVYNAAPAAVNITGIEYFFDNSQPFGNATALTGFINSPNVSSFAGTVSLTGLVPGFHRLYIRSKDANGIWSITNNSPVDNFGTPVYNDAPPAPVNVVRLEYFIDNNDLGFGNCTQIPFTPGTDIANLNANINITGLPSGVHRLFIRSKDADGKWSITNLSVFDNSAIMPYPPAAAAAPAINNMEYYIDSDPGFGNATAISVPGNSGDISNYAINISLSGTLSTGTHYLYIRSRQNPWSVTDVIPFNAGGVVPLTWSFVKAQLINDQTLVSWATLQESNTKDFEIEHSTDGRNFVKIGERSAAGFSTSVRNYSFTHLYPATGLNYYRIKQIDLDGSSEYSVIVTVLKKTGLRSTIIAPNPVKNILHVIEPGPVFIRSAEIFNSSGVLLLRKTIDTDAQVYSLPADKLISGAYVIRINYKTGSRSYPFVKE
jgi:hypothetical protein